jgi:hypothetical protein
MNFRAVVTNMKSVFVMIEIKWSVRMMERSNRVNAHIGFRVFDFGLDRLCQN